MKILRGITSNPDQPATSPRPVGVVFFELRGGDILHPLGSGDWFGTGFARIWRAWCPWAVLPFLSYRIGRHWGYIGFKAYGADSDAYRAWMPAADVYPGSVALQVSARLWASD